MFAWLEISWFHRTRLEFRKTAFCQLNFCTWTCSDTTNDYSCLIIIRTRNDLIQSWIITHTLCNQPTHTHTTDQKHIYISHSTHQSILDELAIEHNHTWTSPENDRMALLEYLSFAQHSSTVEGSLEQRKRSKYSHILRYHHTQATTLLQMESYRTTTTSSSSSEEWDNVDVFVWLPVVEFDGCTVKWRDLCTWKFVWFCFSIRTQTICLIPKLKFTISTNQQQEKKRCYRKKRRITDGYPVLTTTLLNSGMTWQSVIHFGWDRVCWSFLYDFIMLMLKVVKEKKR